MRARSLLFTFNPKRSDSMYPVRTSKDADDDRPEPLGMLPYITMSIPLLIVSPRPSNAHIMPLG